MPTIEPDIIIDEDTRSIFDSLRRVVRALQIQTRKARSTIGLNGAQVGLLDVLAKHRNGLTSSELAIRLLTHTGNFASSLQKLIELGLARKSPDVRDARRILIEVTAEGIDTLARIGGSVQLKLLKALEQMSAAERHDMSRLLRSWANKAKLGAAPYLLMEDDDDEPEPPVSSPQL